MMTIETVQQSERSHQFESSWWQNMTLSRTALETPNKATIWNTNNLHLQ